MSDNKADDKTEGSVSGDKIRFKFIFANRDGVTVETDCSPSDTVTMMKLSLISNWPKEIGATPPKPDRIRLICMGKGILGPDNASIETCSLPVFLTHPTPINVSVKPENLDVKESRRIIMTGGQGTRTNHSNDDNVGDCCCVIS